MAVQMLPGDVADAFVKQYYAILSKSPHNLHKFYQESSLLGWPGSDGVITPVTTLIEINDKVMSSDFKDWSVEIKTADAQESIEGAVLVVVTGCLNAEEVNKNFSQTFILAKQEKGFFVLNDVLHFFDVSESVKEVVANDDRTDGQVPAVPEQNSVTHSVSDRPASLDAEVIPKHINLLETRSKDSDAKISASTSPVASQEKLNSIVAPASKTKEVPKKVSYASMVVKETSQSSLKTALVSSSADNQAIAPPIAKAMAPSVDGVCKVSPTNTAATTKAATPTGDGVSKPSVLPSNVAPKLPKGSNGAQISSAYPEARAVYIGNLPHDVTKQGVLEVVKRFGQVRRSSDSIQIRRHEDGFCCGFVEFESSDSARRAVEVHHVKFGEREAYITYKRSPYRGNDGGRERSPPRAGPRAGNSRWRENGEVSKDQKFQNENQSGYGKGKPRGPRRSRSSGQWTSDEEDGQGWSSRR